MNESVYIDPLTVFAEEQEKFVFKFFHDLDYDGIWIKRRQTYMLVGSGKKDARFSILAEAFHTLFPSYRYVSFLGESYFMISWDPPKEYTLA